MTPSQRAQILAIYTQLEEVSATGGGYLHPKRLSLIVTSLKALVDSAQSAITCQSADCGKPLVYSGEGRRPKYCDSKCRQRAFYRRNSGKGAVYDETR